MNESDYERIGRFIYAFHRYGNPEKLRLLATLPEATPGLAARGAALAQRFDDALAMWKPDQHGNAPAGVSDEYLRTILDDL